MSLAKLKAGQVVADPELMEAILELDAKIEALVLGGGMSFEGKVVTVTIEALEPQVEPVIPPPGGGSDR